MNLLNLRPDNAVEHVSQTVKSAGFERYRITQAFDWLWKNPVDDWRNATNLPAALKTHLQSVAPITRPELLQQQESRDGTIKYLWGLDDGAVETVMIPEGKRVTLCISSQVGCAFGCTFCATGTMKFGRNLEPWEITAQVRELHIRGLKPSNIVFMGMGEPLHNWEAVDVALTQLNSATGFGIGARHITVSTVGLVPGLASLAARPEQFRLAVSLHSADHETRARIMPVERKYPLSELEKALTAFHRRVTLEYVMIRGVNDSESAAEDLCRLAARLGAHVNILPLHPGSGADLTPTPASGIQRFARIVEQKGVPVSVRRSRGKDIDAACGQLAARKA